MDDQPITRLSAEQFLRLEALFHELADLIAGEQTRRLREIESAEPALYPDLLRMLRDTRADQREQLDGLMELAGQVAESLRVRLHNSLS